MRILALQLKRLGDVLLTAPALGCLREQFPDAEIVLAVDAAGAVAASVLPERVIVASRGGGLTREFWRTVAGRRFDVCLDFCGTDRATLIAGFSLSRRRITYQRFRRKLPIRLVYREFVDSSVQKRHTADHFCDLLQPLSISREGVPLRLKAEALQGLPPRLVVVHPGTARKEKYWVPARWAQVIGYLQAQGFYPVLTGIPQSEEERHRWEIQKCLAKPIPDWSQDMTFPKLAGLIQGASLFCGVDSAPAHLADGLGTPSIVLFGPTNAFHWRPRGPQSVVVRASPDPDISPKETPGAMVNISVEHVVQEIDRLLAGGFERS